MRSTLNNGWGNPGSSIAPQYEAGVLFRATGTYIHNDTLMPFTLTRQRPGKSNCTFRGNIRVMSPETGYVLTASSAGRKKPVKIELSSNEENVEALKRYIAKRAEKLYLKYAVEINKAHQRAFGNAAVTPETITPAMACRLYGARFISKRYPNSSPKKNAERKNSLERFYGGLLNEPMCKFSARQIELHIKRGGFGKNTVRLSEEFWEYCFDHQYSTGLNPFPQKEETRKSAETLQNEAMRANTLSQETQDKLFEVLMEEPSGMDCGVALLWSGFSAEEVCGLKWEDIKFDPVRRDFTLVKSFHPARAGAQHNYTRPTTPQCALTLRANYECQAMSKSRKKAMEKEFVVGGKIQITSAELSKYATKKLLLAGVQEDTLTAAKKEASTDAAARTLLKNTYRANLARKCGLRSESGTFKFLCGLSLADDISSSNYTSFTNPEAAERLYSILKVLAPVTPIEAIESVKNDDGITHYITPRNTAEAAGVIVKGVLMPGEEIEIICEHGVTGSFRTNSVDVGNGE